MMKIGGQAGAMALALVDSAGIFCTRGTAALSGGFIIRQSMAARPVAGPALKQPIAS